MPRLKSDLEVEHLYGLKEIPYGEEELIVVCLVRNGQPWVKSFVEHYFSLGVKHIVFLDNASTDDTVVEARLYDNVTVLQSRQPFPRYQGLMRRYLIARFGKDRWSLCVDIDELFDYPYSDVIGLDSLLGYLNSKSYTAVTAQTLDMFPERPLAERADEPDEPLKKVHRFYDTSWLRTEYMGENSGRNNAFDSDELQVFYNGIRTAVFRIKPPLTKFPLTFSDGKVTPVPANIHKVNNAKIADFSCVLFHYKFLKHFPEQTVRAVREQNYWNNSAQYKLYQRALDENPSLKLKQETSREITSINDLLEDGFLVASEDYISWVNAEEERRILRAQRSEPRELVEAFLKSRRHERAKTLKMQRLKRELRDRDRTMRGLREAQRSSEQQNQRLISQARSLTRQVRGLEQRLENIEASRTWRLAALLARIKVRVLSLGKQTSRT